MNNHTAKIRSVGLIVMAIGCCSLGFVLLVILAYATNPEESIHSDDVFFAVVSFCMGIVLNIIGFFIWRIGKKYQRYVDAIMFGNVTNAAEIAAALKISREKALKELQQMINRHFLQNCYIDPKNNEFIMSMVMTAGGVPCPPIGLRAMKTVKCQSCGADNSLKPGQPAKCEYCGTPLSNR